MAGPLIVMFALLVIALGWAVIEIRRLNDSIGPLASSPVARFLAGIGS